MKSALITLLAASVVSAPSCTSTSANERPVPHSANAATGAHTVDELLAIVSASKAKFQYLVDTTIHVDTGRELADALRAKYVNAGSPEMRPDEFIAHFATRSDDAGATYYMRQDDGSRVVLADWLRTQIAP